MGIECKVCNSEKREYIEQLILQGNSNLTISATLKDMNEDISHASINRHKTKHMPDYAEKIKEQSGEKGNRKYDREDSKNAFIINANDIYNEVKNQALHVISYDELAETNMTVRLMLNRILNNQLAITIDLQEKYMQGESKYPNEQIRGLQIMQDMTQKFEDFARKNFSHYKNLVHSGNGIKRHIMELGKKAKEEYNLIKPYEKGMLFSILINDNFEVYEKEFSPDNPYTLSDFDNNCDYNYFIKGIELGKSTVEKLDVKLFRVMQEVYQDYELLPEKDMEKVMLRYSSGKYEVCKELKKYEAILKKYEDSPDIDEDEDEDET